MNFCLGVVMDAHYFFLIFVFISFFDFCLMFFRLALNIKMS